MPTIKQFCLPDPAEGLTEAEIVSWRVEVGDTVTLNQTVVEIETAKSLVELPSPFAGVVVEIHVPAGQVAAVGSPIISIDVDPRGPTAGTPDRRPAAASTTARRPVLVGYGPKDSTATRRPRRAWPHAFGPGSPVAQSAATGLHSAYSAERPVATPVAPPRPPRAVTPVPSEPTSGRSLPEVGEAPAPPLPQRVRKLAKPPVRKLARELGVDLATIEGSGMQGLVTRQDVQDAADAADAASGRGSVSPGVGVSRRSATRAVEADHSSTDGLGHPTTDAREERIAIKGVRRLTAEAMVASAFTAPHVTVWVSVNVTRSMDLIRRLRRRAEFAGTKLTPLALVAKALCLAVSRHPAINSTWDEPAGQIVLKHYVNLGVAVSTPRGLLVPNVRDADTLPLPQLAAAIEDLGVRAREGHLSPDRLRGGTITITNVGVFGVDGGTPIINPPEAAILAMGQVRAMPWVVAGELAVAEVMQLSLSFDHRLVDGELGSRVLADVAAVMEEPDLALAW